MSFGGGGLGGFVDLESSFDLSVADDEGIVISDDDIYRMAIYWPSFLDVEIESEVTQ